MAMPVPSADFYLKLLSDRNPNVRKKAAQLLGQIGDKSCLFRLIDALKQEKNADVLEAIRGAIAKLES
jgi:HEAT repeat protein